MDADIFVEHFKAHQPTVEKLIKDNELPSMFDEIRGWYDAPLRTPALPRQADPIIDLVTRYDTGTLSVASFQFLPELRKLRITADRPATQFGQVECDPFVIDHSNGQIFQLLPEDHSHCFRIAMNSHRFLDALAYIVSECAKKPADPDELDHLGCLMDSSPRVQRIGGEANRIAGSDERYQFFDQLVTP